jgi:polar amino acid transport system substrate-binding protein
LAYSGKRSFLHLGTNGGDRPLRWIQVLIGVAVLLLCVHATAAEKLIIGTTEWWPWQIREESKFTGITPEMLEELSKRTGIAMPIRHLPQKRMLQMFATQEIDMEPTVSRAWREGQSGISVYTIPFYITGDIILVRKGSGIRGSSVSDFTGLSIGCGLGYFYPEGFQEAFERGDILRQDNPHSEKNILKLASGWIDGAIVERVQARYILQRGKLDPRSFEVAFAFQPSKLSLRLHKNRQDLLPVLNRALETMISDGTIKNIIARYAGNTRIGKAPSPAVDH